MSNQMDTHNHIFNMLKESVMTINDIIEKTGLSYSVINGWHLSRMLKNKSIYKFVKAIDGRVHTVYCASKQKFMPKTKYQLFVSQLGKDQIEKGFVINEIIDSVTFGLSSIRSFLIEMESDGIINRIEQFNGKSTEIKYFSKQEEKKVIKSNSILTKKW